MVYFKNERLGFSVTYYGSSRPRQYFPDFIIATRGHVGCFQLGDDGGGAVKRALAAAHLSGDPERIERAQKRLDRNRLHVQWRRDPSTPGRTIVLVPDDEATCRAWAARQGLQLDALDRDLPALSDACRWIWARMSRGLINDEEVAAKLARLRDRILEADRVDYSR